ncbi:hypothetical protein B0H14DRAFT_1523684 [Mycena olivaceomarginata]|nr:hypothetical protein B0H14DRAFT_1523684 [Mycena olivaceomarginata]
MYISPKLYQYIWLPATLPPARASTLQSLPTGCGAYHQLPGCSAQLDFFRANAWLPQSTSRASRFTDQRDILHGRRVLYLPKHVFGLCSSGSCRICCSFVFSPFQCMDSRPRFLRRPNVRG